MPTLPSRARRWLKAGKAVKRWSDLGGFYVQLTEPPSNTQTQPIVVGIDIIKCFLQCFSQKLIQSFSHPVFEKLCTYRQAIEIQAEMLAGAFDGNSYQFLDKK